MHKNYLSSLRVVTIISLMSTTTFFAASAYAAETAISNPKYCTIGLEQFLSLFKAYSDPTMFAKDMAGIEKGERMFDYLINGIVVFKFLGKKSKTRNAVTNTKHESAGSGLYIVGLRTAIKNDEQIITLVAMYDTRDKEQNDAYLQTIKNLSCNSDEPRKSGYYNGRPCNPSNDGNKTAYELTFADAKELHNIIRQHVVKPKNSAIVSIGKTNPLS
jgi:hypothetical protein